MRCQTKTTTHGGQLCTSVYRVEDWNRRPKLPSIGGHLRFNFSPVDHRVFQLPEFTVAGIHIRTPGEAYSPFSPWWSSRFLFALCTDWGTCVWEWHQSLHFLLSYLKCIKHGRCILAVKILHVYDECYTRSGRGSFGRGSSVIPWTICARSSSS